MAYILITLTLLFNDCASLRRAGIAEFRAGHFTQAEVLLRTAIQSARADNDSYEEALDHSALGNTLEAQQRFSETEREYRKAISMFNDLCLAKNAPELSAKLHHAQPRSPLVLGNAQRPSWFEKLSGRHRYLQ